VQEGLQRVGAKRQLTTQAAVGDDAERVEIRAAVERLPHELLGRRIRGRAHEHASLRDLEGAFVERARDPEVDQLAVLALEEDVGGLEIAVEHAVRVRVRERAAQPEDELRDLVRRESAALREHVLQRLALDELHHEVRSASLGDAEVDDGDDPWVAQARQDLGLADEARLEPRRGRPGAACAIDQLYGDRAIQAELPRAPDRAHRALADRRFEGVPAVQDLGRGAVAHGRRESQSATSVNAIALRRDARPAQMRRCPRVARADVGASSGGATEARRR
jgi:hypothetical protein